MKGDCYEGRGCRLCGLTRSRFANPYKGWQGASDRHVQEILADQIIAVDPLRIMACVPLQGEAGMPRRQPDSLHRNVPSTL